MEFIIDILRCFIPIMHNVLKGNLKNSHLMRMWPRKRPVQMRNKSTNHRTIIEWQPTLIGTFQQELNQIRI